MRPYSLAAILLSMAFLCPADVQAQAKLYVFNVWIFQPNGVQTGSGDIGAGNKGKIAILLDAPAPAGGAVVTLSSSDPSIVLPSTVTISAGQTNLPAFVPIVTRSVSVRTPVTLTASYAGTTMTDVAYVVPEANVAAVTLSPASAYGGAIDSRTVGIDVIATVTLDNPAPPGGTTVDLTSSVPAVASVPTTVKVEPGTRNQDFRILTRYVSSTTPVVISASYGGITKTNILTVLPSSVPGIKNLESDGDKIYAGAASAVALFYPPNAITGTITLNSPAPAGGAMITLSSTNPSTVSVPATVLIPMNQVSTTFPITTAGYSSEGQSKIIAAYQGITREISVRVAPGSTVEELLLPTSATGGDVVTATIRIRSAVPVGEIVIPVELFGEKYPAIGLVASPAYASMPPSVTIPTGQKQASIQITTLPVNVPRALKVCPTRPDNPLQKECLILGRGGAAGDWGKELTLLPRGAGIGLDVFNVFVPTPNGGWSGSGDIAAGHKGRFAIMLNAPAPAGGAVVTLSSGDPSVELPSTVTIPAGQNSAGSVPIVTRAVTVRTPVTLSGTYAGTTMTSVINVAPAATVSVLSVSPASVQGGTMSKLTVTLDKPAPPGGITVSLSSSIPLAAAVFSDFMFREGESTTSFSIVTSSVKASTPVVITSSFAGLTKTATLTVEPPPIAAAVKLTNLIQTFTGTGNSVRAATVPAGLLVTFAYDGSPNPPTDPGSYTVVATVSDVRYTGQAQATFRIRKAPSSVTVKCSTPQPHTGVNVTPCTATASGVALNPVDITPSLVYSNNINTGTANAKATYAGDARHSGSSSSRTFEIVVPASSGPARITRPGREFPSPDPNTGGSNAPIGRGSFRVTLPTGIVSGKATFCSMPAMDGMLAVYLQGDGISGGINGRTKKKAAGTFPVLPGGEAGFEIAIVRIAPIPAAYPAESGELKITSWTDALLTGTFTIKGKVNDVEGLEQEHSVTGSFSATPLGGC